MITVTAGRTFLEAFNKKYNKKYSSKEFFEKVYFEIFFNHQKYMQWPTNSPFVQMEKGQKVNTLSAEERLEKLKKLHVKIANGDKDASIAIGFPASEKDEFATTSGQITDINIPYTEDEIYYSWIGSGLCLGVSGGFSILFNSPDILLKIYEGWKVYRKFLNDPTIGNLAPNKITSWNGQWINYAYSNDYKENFDFATLNNYGFFKTTTKDGTVIETIKWSKLFFNLSSNFSNQTLTGYVFSLGQMNKTLGFYPFHFKQARKIITFYKKLFGENAAFKDARYYENMYGIHIKRACELGAFGIQALEPEGLKKYFKDPEKIPNLKKTKISRKKNEEEEDYLKRKTDADEKDYVKKLIPFRIYKTWLIAMINKNKEEFSDYTQEVAKTLYEYVTAQRKEKAGSTKASNTVKKLLSSKSKKIFLECMTEILETNLLNNDQIKAFNDLRNNIHFMNNENFGYFVILLKFDYAYQTRIS